MPLWILDMLLAANGQTFTAQWRPARDINDDEARCLDPINARAAQARLIAGSTAIAVSVETERVKEVGSPPFDLGTLQKICSKNLGLRAQEAV